MIKYLILLAMMFGSTVWGNQITVQMLNIPVDFPQEPNFFFFDIDGQIWKLLCDQFQPNVTSLQYTAKVATLNDLSGTALDRLNDPNALTKYQWVAILDLMAYEDPSKATDVTWANRFIIDGSGPLPGQAGALVAFVQTQNAANYDLSGFRIFYGVTPDGRFLETQEQTGFAPEPGTFLLVISALGGFALLRRHRTRSKTQLGVTDNQSDPMPSPQ